MKKQKKIYIITSGNYSDYYIECCFTSYAKAQEYIERMKKEEVLLDTYRIEEYPLNAKPIPTTEICLKLYSPILQEGTKKKCEIWDIKVAEYDGSEDTRIMNGFLYLRRIANPNKSLEEEEERVKRIGYDLLTRINYLLKVVNVNFNDLNKYIK